MPSIPGDVPYQLSLTPKTCFLEGLWMRWTFQQPSLFNPSQRSKEPPGGVLVSEPCMILYELSTGHQSEGRLWGAYLPDKVQDDSLCETKSQHLWGF